MYGITRHIMDINTLIGISSIFDKNIGRVKNLINLFRSLTARKRGRRSTNETDLLRVAIVLLHSSMEDCLRSILKLRLPEVGSKETLKKIPLISSSNNDRRNTKFELGELMEYKGETIQTIIEKSIEKYFDEVSFNDVSDITANLSSINIILTDEIKERYFSTITQMIKRRHNIVHQADRSVTNDYRIGSAKKIDLPTVENYILVVDEFMNEIYKNLKSQIV